MPDKPLGPSAIIGPSSVLAHRPSRDPRSAPGPRGELAPSPAKTGHGMVAEMFDGYGPNYCMAGRCNRESALDRNANRRRASSTDRTRAMTLHAVRATGRCRSSGNRCTSFRSAPSGRSIRCSPKNSLICVRMRTCRRAYRLRGAFGALRAVPGPRRTSASKTASSRHASEPDPASGCGPARARFSPTYGTPPSKTGRYSRIVNMKVVTPSTGIIS